MKISIIQQNIVWEDKTRNFERLEKLVSNLSNTDIIILPEMFNTGFSMDPERLGEPPFSETFDWMLHASEEGNFGICGSYIVKENGNFYNRWLFVTPEKKSWQYDKRHLFTITNEESSFTHGTKRLIFKFRGVKISPNICYDLRFPVWSRNRNDYDLLINSANWPEPRRDVWLTLLKARAIENLCYVAGANRVGTDGNSVKYCGDSMIISPKGEILASAQKNKECSISADISMTELTEFRKKFPVQKDADKFSIEP
jgi:predicted amidohydrolase